jgi:Coatomer (COPI) alpha subunit C-terminus.
VDLTAFDCCGNTCYAAFPCLNYKIFIRLVREHSTESFTLKSKLVVLDFAFFRSSLKIESKFTRDGRFEPILHQFLLKLQNTCTFVVKLTGDLSRLSNLHLD